VRVRLNCKDLGTLIMLPYRVSVDELQPKANKLEIEVTNLSANRLRDLDRRKVQWRIFNDINFVSINYKVSTPPNGPSAPPASSALSRCTSLPRQHCRFPLSVRTG
jgi:hypothetical protein